MLLDIAVVCIIAAILLAGIRALRRSESDASLHGQEPSPARTLEFGDLFDRTDVLILDVEITGLGNRAEILEIAIVDTTGTTRYSAPVMPQSRISADASYVHGLTRKRLRELNATPWPEHHATVTGLLAQATVG